MVRQGVQRERGADCRGGRPGSWAVQEDLWHSRGFLSPRLSSAPSCSQRGSTANVASPQPHHPGRDPVRHRRARAEHTLLARVPRYAYSLGWVRFQQHAQSQRNYMLVCRTCPPCRRARQVASRHARARTITHTQTHRRVLSCTVLQRRPRNVHAYRQTRARFYAGADACRAQTH